VYDEEDNLLDEKPIDAIEVEKRKKIAVVRNKVEDLIQIAKSSNDAMDLLVSGVLNISLGYIFCSYNTEPDICLSIQFTVGPLLRLR
jgi:hypothetical protein